MSSTTPIYGLPYAVPGDPADGSGNEASMMGGTDTAIAGLRVRKSADENVISSTALQNDDALLLPVVASSSYWVKLFLIYTSPAAAFLKIGWTAPASATLDWVANGLGSTVSAASAGVIERAALAIGGSQVIGCDGATSVVALVEGWLITGATPGNLQFQWAQGTSTASNSTVKAGSTLWLRKTS